MGRNLIVIWNLACAAWVAAPILSFWKGANTQVSQMVWWILASILVIGCSTFKKVERDVEGIQLFILAAIAVFVAHGFFLYTETTFAFGSAWLLKVSVIMSAAILIAQRESWHNLFKYLQLCLVFQIPILLVQKMNMNNPWGSAHGTLGTRAGVGILAAYIAVNSKGISSWIGTAMSVISTSMAGLIPAVANRIWGFKKYRLAISLATLIVLFNMPMQARASSRFEAWSSLSFLKRGWMTGWGFLPMAGTFRLDADNGKAWASVRFTDYHSTFLDWIARFGLIGVLAISPLMLWIAQRTFHQPDSWKVWNLFLALFAGMVQSAEGILVMVLLGLMWFMRLNEEDSRVHTLA